MVRRFLPVLTALVLLLSGCGDDDDASASGDDTAADDDDAASGDGVTIQDFAFAPESIEVEAGTTLTWSNGDGVTHTVTSGADGASDGTFDESVEGGESAEISFGEAGTFAYFCAIHPTMTGEVVVS